MTSPATGTMDTTTPSESGDVPPVTDHNAAAETVSKEQVPPTTDAKVDDDGDGMEYTMNHII